ncbi:MAG: T9SS type A sorting domain-containing protein [Flavobacteriales bacterium]|nr:T9SS type A sorting domain-containing protein [Flavobacteriales bacterium]MCB9447261.1 T9SS type A sorting domain-containing protein [Flavobacteriales bacterium]
MYRIITFLLFFSLSCGAQIIPASRRVQWNLAGFRGNIPSYGRLVSITSFGGTGDSVTVNNSALQHAIQSLGGHSGVIYFPEGTYLFTSAFTIPDSVVIRGASSDSTCLRFNLAGNNQDLFTVQGYLSEVHAFFTQPAEKDSSFISVDNVAGLAPGDYIRIVQNDSSLVTSSWAYGSVGQIVRILSIDSTRIHLDSPLRKSYALSEHPRMIKMLPARYAGFECFRIERMDVTTGQTSNIQFTYAVKCWVAGLESDKANYAHINISASSNVLVSGCYFHHAFDYGEGGRGYGVVLEYTSGECLVQNNIFNFLRHAMLLQAGSNGNVVGYNYSLNPNWDQFPFPDNASGDAVLHGNYAYANLFESNIIQNIVIDDSHGINGPYNTFFRNRAELYGLVMNNNPPSNYQNFVGNEITNTGFLKGQYALNGAGHLEYGNNVRGTITPTNTSNLPDSSYYLKSYPEFYPPLYTWPSIGTPAPYNQLGIPAKDRFTSGMYTVCSTNVHTSVNPGPNRNRIRLFPNPAENVVYISSDGQNVLPADIEVRDGTGRLLIRTKHNACKCIHLNGLPEGIYFIRIGTQYFRIIKRE